MSVTSIYTADASELVRQLRVSLDVFCARHGNPLADKVSEKYLAAFKPCSAAIYLPQDTAGLVQRTADLLGGIPYTSATYHWPKYTVGGLPMQPIIQLNLKAAGERLGHSFGDDLLQVWAPVAAKLNDLPVDARAFLLRRIPLAATAEPADESTPDWRSLPGQQVRSAYLMEIDEDHPAFNSPRLDWAPLLPMYGSAHHVDQLFHQIACQDLADPDWDEISNLQEEFDDVISDSILTPGGAYIYLGGFGGQDGHDGSDPTSAPNLLVRISDSTGFHCGIHWRESVNASFEFYVDFTIRPG